MTLLLVIFNMGNCRDVLIYVPFAATAKILDIDSPERPIRDLEYSTGLAVFNRDGTRLGFRAVENTPDHGHIFIIYDTSDENPLNWVKIRTLSGFKERINQATFSPDGTKLAFGLRKGHIEVRDVATGNMIKYFRAHSRPISSVVFSGDGKKLASGSRKGVRRIKIWDTSDWRLKQSISPQSSVEALAFNSNGTVLFVRIDDDGFVEIWSLNNGARLKRTLKISARGGKNLLVSDHNAEKLAFNDGSNIKILDTSGWQSRTIGVHDLFGKRNDNNLQYSYSSLSFNHDGSKLAIGATIKRGMSIPKSVIIIWDIQGWKVLKKIELRKSGIHSLAFQSRADLQEEIRREQEEERLGFLQKRYIRWPSVPKKAVEVQTGQPGKIVVPRSLLVPTTREQEGLEQLIRNLKDLRRETSLQDFRKLTDELSKQLKILRSRERRRRR